MTARLKIRRRIFILLACWLPLTLPGQTPQVITHSFFLIGDAGEPYVDKDPLGKVFHQQVADAGIHATVLFLGDNVYPAGLVDPGAKSRKEGEHILETQVSWVRGLDARAIFVPGNHDWNHWGRQGYQYILNQQAWLDSLHDANITFLPRGGCPGPVEISINEQVVLVILDTQWFLHQYDKPGGGSSCEANTMIEAMAMLSEIVSRNKHKRIIAVGHHPVFTYGDHGGVFTWKDHLFPLRDLSAKSNLYIPLPVIGSAYVFYRKFFGSIQDTVHPEYKRLLRSLHEEFSKSDGSIYAAGHEHALQYIVKDNTHYIVSGSGAKTADVKTKKYARFAEGVRGFVRLDVLAGGEIAIHFIQVDESTPEGKEIYATSVDPLSEQE